MNYEKYIFDWQNELLNEYEYLDTDKYAFSLFKKAKIMLEKHINTYEMDIDERENIKLISNLLTEIYLEISHIELEFDNGVIDNWW